MITGALDTPTVRERHTIFLVDGIGESATWKKVGVIAFYQFVLFWINGVAGVNAPAMTYWGPVVTDALIWPLLTLFFTGVYYRVKQGD